MSSRDRLHWPEARTQADTGPGSFASWLAGLSDESLALLEAIMRLHADAPTWAPWALPLIERIRAEGASAAPQPVPAIKARPLSEPRDFGDVLEATWPRADRDTREALRTIATALGVPVPEPEPERPLIPAPRAHNRPSGTDQEAPVQREPRPALRRSARSSPRS